MKSEQAKHLIEDCPQNPTFAHIGSTLNRLEGYAKRQAEAMEELAQQSIILVNHERRLDDHGAEIKDLTERVIELELVQATERGALEVSEKRCRFWDGVRQQMTPYLVGFIFFVFYMLDKFNIPQFIAKVWKEMHG